MTRQRQDQVVLELRLEGKKPACRALFAHTSRDAAYFTEESHNASSPHSSTLDRSSLLSKLSIPVEWAVSSSEPESRRKTHVLEAAGILLAKLPTNHVAPLRRGGIRFFKGDRSLGGYYEVNSSTINVNVGVHPTVLVMSLLHEMGHLVHFEVVDPKVGNKYTRLGWLQLGPVRIRGSSGDIRRPPS